LVAAALLFSGSRRLPGQTGAKQLEIELADAAGRERIELLAELAAAHWSQDPAKSVSFGTEALELLGPGEADRRLRLRIAQSLTSAHLQRQDLQAALQHALRAEELARALGEGGALADALAQLGHVRYLSSDYRRALAITEEAFALYEELGDRAGLADANSQIGAIHWGRSEYSQATASFLRALRLYEELGNQFRSAGMRNNLGVIYMEMGQLDRALELHRRALAFHESEGNQKQIAGILNNVARIHESQGNLGAALAALERAREIHESIGNRRGLSFALHQLGIVYGDLGDRERALEYYERALHVREELGERKLIAGTLANIAGLRRQQGESNAAIATLARALVIAEEIGAKAEIADITRELSGIYAEAGRFEEALAAFQRYEEVQREIFNEESSENIAEMQARFDSEQKEKEIELLRQQKELDALELRRQVFIRRTIVAGFAVLALVASTVGYGVWQRKRIERERAVTRRLREVDKLKDEFLANTSHELRTPLYGIVSLADSLLSGVAGPLPERARNPLAMIASSGRRLAHLVGDILDFSKLRRQSLELVTRPVDLRAMVNVVLTLSEPLVGSKELELKNGVAPELPPAVADENRLQQILLNLVGNAVKFTDSGRVEVSAAARGGRLVVCVADTGIGIPEGKRERIFDAFEQADASIEREYGGTGLGLAITRQLVELHGGRIWVESTPGDGSSFYLDLPIADPSQAVPPRPRAAGGMPVAPTWELDADARATEPAPVAASADPPDAAPASPPGAVARLLAVDDEPINREVLRSFLAGSGYQLVVASNGEEALRRLDEGPFDLVLLDVMMPRMSGYEVCRILRRQRSLEELPVIFLTAKNQTSDVVTGMALGANDYLTKPISKDELLARVRPHLDLVRVHRDLEHLVEEKVSQIKILRGLLPICASCKKIRDDEGYWSELEIFIDSHSEARFTHGICPDCEVRYREQMWPRWETKA